jgi:hypothetical protein
MILTYVPNGKTAHPNVNKLKQTLLLLDRKGNKSKYQVITEENMVEISAKLEHSPQKFTRHPE